ncbi:hypothetical protein [Leifsonia sp. Leaf264]|uniref:hypothetical protein n=1 Tax=Leifsonia sp. Leaf264 TaxID=1736314 RepID=UPI0006FFFB01|nr:hypothetical protein [Leifsonia sp. Leaf264]KQO98816.1 hypothetical protein ASF30_12195 [Leifsonia sp. Leaf264]
MPAAATTTSSTAKKAAVAAAGATAKKAAPKRRTVSKKAAEVVIKDAVADTSWMDENSVIIDGHMFIFAEEDAAVVTITSEDARMLIGRNTRNRKPSAENLNKIITDLNNGDYVFNGQSISITKTGLIADGQHRLLGCMETGVSIRNVVVTGVDDENVKNVDTGKARTLIDILEYAGEVNTIGLATAIKAIQGWELGERVPGSAPKGKITINTGVEFLRQHPELRDIAREAQGLSKRVPGLTMKQLAILIWAFDRIDEESELDRKAFFEKLIKGSGLAEGDPILALRNFLARDSASAKKATPYHRFAITAKAWNLHRDGAIVGTLKFKAGGEKAEAFPEPM